MNEDKIMQLLSNLDDDLVEKEIDKLLDGVEIDMESINKKAHNKLNNEINNEHKKVRIRKKRFYILVACLIILSVTSLYAKDISKAVLSFFNKTPVYDTIVDGEAYYLKDNLKLDEHLTIESLMVSEGNLEMELISDLSLDEFGNIYIMSKDNPDVVYSVGGFSYEDNGYYFSFMNEKEENYHIVPFKDFTFVAAGKTYEVALDTAVSFDIESQIYTANEAQSSEIGVNMGAKLFEKDGKLMVQIITSFEDERLQLAKIGKPQKADAYVEYENLGEKGTRSSSTGLIVDTLYVQDESGENYSLDIPKDAKGRPVTMFETNAPKGKELTLKVPSIVACYPEEIEKLKVSIPKEGEVSINQEIDFGIQKAKVKSIKRLSPTSASIEFELNTALNDKIHLRSLSFYSTDIKKAETKFDANKAIMTLEFDEEIDAVNISVSYPDFVIDGDWMINMN